MTVAQFHPLPMSVPSFTHGLSGWLKRFFAVGPVRPSACPAAWELAGITRIDRFDIAPWLSF